jgi:multiple sugar transport system substrate-binding protein
MQKKRFSRREFLALAGATGGAALLAACGEEATPEKEIVEVTRVVSEEVEVTRVVSEEVEVTRVVEEMVEVTTAPPEPITLTIWHHWGGTREPLLNAELENFSARNPGVTVEPTIIPWDQKEATILSAVAAGEAPDVLMLNAAEMPPYAMNDAILPVDDMVDAAGIMADEAYESDWQASFYNGKQWGLPHTIGGAAFLLFYNKDHLSEVGLDPNQPPQTWADFMSYTEKLVKMEGNTVQRIGGMPYVSSWGWLSYLAGNDAAWLSEDGREVLMDNEASVEALQFIVDTVDAQGGWEAIQAFTSAQGETDPFLAGNISMSYSGIWNYFMLQQNAPELNYVSAVAPNTGGKWHEGNYGPHLWTIPASTDHSSEAWKLVMWMSYEDGGCNFLTQQGRAAPWKACTENSIMANVADYWPVVVEAIATTRPEPLTPVFNQFQSIWDEMLERALFKADDSAGAISWAAEEMTKVNDEYWG